MFTFLSRYLSLVIWVMSHVIYMSKAKTHQATAKRFKMKKTKKGIQVIKRTNGQDHFNSRESGKTKRNKRSDVTMAKAFHDTIKKALKNG